MNEEEEDEWFYNSIKRYNQLRMFETANIIRHVGLLTSKSICVVGRHDKLGKDEIIELALPQKITVLDINAKIVKDCDLKVEKGGFASSHVFQMSILDDHKKLILSEEGQNGVSIYDCSSQESDIINKVNHFTCDHVTPRFSINGSRSIVMATTIADPVLIMDINSGQVTSDIHVKRTTMSKEEYFEPKYITENIIAICNKSSGTIYINDDRTDNYTKLNHERTRLAQSEIWTMSSPYKISQDYTSTKFGCVATDGHFLAYDIRNTQVSLCDCLIEGNLVSDFTKSPNDISLQIRSDTECFSLSGFDKNVYLFKIKSDNELTSVFVHDGHANTNTKPNNLITCHLWFKEDILVSAADDKSIHCWQFITN